MFTRKSFTVFEVDGLEERMAAIRAHIQPNFQLIGEEVIKQLQPDLNEVLPLHIAQHRRRTAYAPESTWCAFGGDKRGYKKYPHFELTINDDYLGMWLSFIDNPQFEKEIAVFFLEHRAMFQTLTPDFILSADHTESDYCPLNEKNLEKVLKRWHNVKKGECMIGRLIKKNDALLTDPDAARTFILETYQQLVPFYLAAMQVRKEQLK